VNESPSAPGADVAVEARGLGKRYAIYASDRGRIREFFGERQHHVEFWALRDLSFRIKRGSAFGVVGANGAGKSTLLRLLSGVSQPSEGELFVRARRPGLLDLGMGFHPDFTGLDNIRLNCTLLGMDEDQAHEIVPKVVEFAELEDFVDFPVRTYSAGMQLRLAFSVAAHMDYDVIYLDEVLAVGDQYFQRKCIRRIEEFLADGRTLVLVSHDLHSIRSLCGEVAWLHAGRLVAQGSAQEVVSAYVDVARDKEGRIRARLFGGAESTHARDMQRRVADESGLAREGSGTGTGALPEDANQAAGRTGRAESTESETWFATTRDPELRGALSVALRFPGAAAEWARAESVADYEAMHGEQPAVSGSGEARILRVRLLDARGAERAEFGTGEALSVAVTFKTLQPIERPILGVAIFRNDGLYVFGPNTRWDEVHAMEGTYDGIYSYFLHYPSIPLLTGIYRLSVALFDKQHLRPHVWHNQLYEFSVRCAREDHGVVQVPHHWGLVRHVSGEHEQLP
jgi:ABC-type polysaccharide/polyol phosphate transport system ATPase subunit